MPTLPWKSFSSFYCFTLAVLIIGQLGLGKYMTELEFLHPWYNAAPRLHKGIGLLIAAMAVLYLASMVRTGIPTFREFVVSLKYNIYGVQHLLLYGLILSTVTAGFAFASSTGDPVPFFGLVEIPSPFSLGKRTVEFLDAAHFVLAISLAILILIHIIERIRFMFRRRKLERAK